jgi:hypothetical protein
VNLLIQALIGGLLCALVSALIAPLYKNDRLEVAVAGFIAGAAVQVLLALAFYAWEAL